MAPELGKVVVTGGAGFIGSHLIDRLMSDECAEVVALDNFSRGRIGNIGAWRSDPRLQVIQGDIRDPAVLASVFDGARTVFHLAAQSTVMGAVADIDYTFSTNVIGTYNVLRAASKNQVERLIYASSREVYGEPIALPVDEESPLLAINSYGASKAAGEAYCRAFRREFGLQAFVLRLANVYGPRDYGRVIPRWIDAVHQRRDITVYGGKQVLDFVWVDQVVEAFLRAATHDGPLPAINIGSGTGTRIVDLARRIARLAEAPGHLSLQPARTMEVTRYIASIERMRTILKIEPPLDSLAELSALVPIALAS